MESPTCITVWMGDNVPERYRQLEWLKDFAPGEDANGAISKDGEIVVFVAHVPRAVLASPVYQQGNWEKEHDGWMAQGQSGLFGTNCLSVHDHPDGDGVLIVGLAM